MACDQGTGLLQVHILVCGFCFTLACTVSSCILKHTPAKAHHNVGPVHLPIVVHSLCTANSHLQWDRCSHGHTFARDSHSCSYHTEYCCNLVARQHYSSHCTAALVSQWVVYIRVALLQGLSAVQAAPEPQHKNLHPCMGSRFRV